MSPRYDADARIPGTIRHMIRVIVLKQYLSANSSLSSPELDQRDSGQPVNCRQSRFRVDAESVHDLMLEISGLLVKQIRRSERKSVSAGRLSGHIELSKRAGRRAATTTCTVGHFTLSGNALSCIRQC